MKRPKDSSPRIPQHDYALELQEAVSWMGDRYLLAEPVTRRVEERKAFFQVPKSWLDSPRPAGPGIRRH